MAFCSKCGKELIPGSRFCVNCGAPVPEKAPEPVVLHEEILPEEPIPVTEGEPVVASEPVSPTVPETPVAPAPMEETAVPTERVPETKAEPAGTPSATSVLVLGIISLVLAFDVTIAGLILSIITLSKAKARESAVGPLSGKASTGRTLAKVALPLSIAFTALFVLIILIYLIFIFVMVSSGNFSYSTTFPPINL